MTAKRALITGITGQDGSYLAEYLINLGYQVHGTVRTTTTDPPNSRIRHLLADQTRVILHAADLGDGQSVTRVVNEVRPDEIYNLAAQSHVSASFSHPVQTGDITALGAVRVLEAIRQIDLSIRFYQASSSEMFGSSPPPQNEATPFYPRSPYGIAKAYAYWATVNYREAYGIHASNGILFNHESPRRGRQFVTRKVTDAIPRLLTGERRTLAMGNLDAQRDWGHARDYVKAMHGMVVADQPGDFVIGTGQSHTVRELVALAFKMVDLDWRDHLVIDPMYYRQADVDSLRADFGKASQDLGWRPETSFQELVEEMVASDMADQGLSIDIT
jgi:GDPmannose 4,6-dehydratase